MGCVPKKVMWNAAQVAETLHIAPDYGFTVSAREFQWETIKTARDAYVRRLNDIYYRNLEKSGVSFVQGTARFVSDHL